MPAKPQQQSNDLSNPYGYSEMDWAAHLDPAYAAARAEVRRLSVGEDGTLSIKVKEFVVMGILASRGLQYGVEAHMRRALDYGATKEELFEAIKAAAVPGGGVAYSVGIRALQTRVHRPLHRAGGAKLPRGNGERTTGDAYGGRGTLGGARGTAPARFRAVFWVRSCPFFPAYSSSTWPTSRLDRALSCIDLGVGCALAPSHSLRAP